MKWGKLSDLTELRFERSRKDLSRLQSHLGQLASDRKVLQAQRDAARNLGQDMHFLRMTGGDLLWKEWLDRSFAALSIEEARTRAQIEYMLPEVKRAFGRTLVAKEIHGKNLTETRKRSL